MTVQWATDVVKNAERFIKASPELTKQITVIGSTIAGAAGAMTLMTTAMATIKALGGLTALFTHPAVLAVTAIGGLTAMLVSMSLTSQKEYQDLIDANNELIESHRKLNEEYKQALGEIDASYYEYGILADQIFMLADAENRSAAEKQRLSWLVDELNQKLPELGLVYDANTDSLNMSTEALQDYIEKLYEEEKQLERIQRLQDLYAQNVEYSSQLKDLTSEIERGEARYAELEKALDSPDPSVYGPAGPELLALEEKLEDLYKEERRLKAAYATSSWEYKAMMYEAEANAKPAEAAEAAVVDNSSGDTNIYFNTDGSWTKEDYLKAMKETGMEITEATIATLDDYFAGRMVY